MTESNTRSPSVRVFGEYRVLETELASYLGVSRTVVRDMMGRLHERGLIRKNTSSHWVTGPLTTQTVKNNTGCAPFLEPAALRLAAPFLSIREIDQTRARIADDTALSPTIWKSCCWDLPCQAPNGAGRPDPAKPAGAVGGEPALTGWPAARPCGARPGTGCCST